MTHGWKSIRRTSIETLHRCVRCGLYRAMRHHKVTYGTKLTKKGALMKRKEAQSRPPCLNQLESHEGER
jgi:hypothetical protein